MRFKRYKSYKLAEDSLEQAAQNLQDCVLHLYKLNSKLDELNYEITGVNEEKRIAEDKLKYLLKQKNRKSITINRVKYYLDEEDNLKRELVLD